MGAGDTAGGLDAVGMGGLPGALGAPGLLATGGAGGLGLLATGGGGGLPARALAGRELTGELSSEPLDADTVFFQGVAEPFAAAMPGKTDTGLAETSAEICFGTTFGPGATEVLFAPAPGGGGGGAAAAFGLGGINSR